MHWQFLIPSPLPILLLRSSSRSRFPRLKQKLPRRPALLREAVLAREDPLSPQPRLLDDALEHLILIRRALVAEEHRATFDLHLHQQKFPKNRLSGERGGGRGLRVCDRGVGSNSPQSSPRHRKPRYRHRTRRPDRPWSAPARPASPCSCSTIGPRPRC